MRGLSGSTWVFLAVAVWAPQAVGGGTGPSEDSLREKTVVLTAPSLAGRGSGTWEADAAAEILAAWMGELDLEPGFGNSFFQEVPLTGSGWAGEDLSGRTGLNVAGILPGFGRLADRYVVVGAHYDHLGRVDPTVGGDAPPADGGYYPGANDNASGVAVLFELMRLAADHAEGGAGCRSVMFVGFIAEEIGLQGSGYLVAHLPVSADSVDAMINLDTIGQLTENQLYVSGVGTTPSFETLVAAADSGDLDLSLARGGWSGSDHMSFNTREIPVLFIFGGAYPQYNRPTDDWPTLDFSAMARIASFTDRLLGLVRREPADLPWVMVAEKGLRPEEGEGQNRQTWLGTLPDFTEDVTGYKLAGVFDDSPAARAGLQKGDVLVGFGGAPVTDLASFTRALRSHGPREPVEIRIDREGRILNFTVILGNRADRD